jgi:predicted nuclease with TOPRIM domain
MRHWNVIGPTRYYGYSYSVITKKFLNAKEKNINLESTVNYLQSTCKEKEEKLSSIQRELSNKEELRQLSGQIQFMASDLKEYGNKRNELRDQVALYEGNKKKMEPPTRK